MTLLLRTVHGSRLYGLANADSDYDVFEVYGWNKFRGRQSIAGSVDRTRQSYDSFMRYCDKGVPQYLEAMFSRVADVDAMPFSRIQYRPGMSNVRDTYRRTIKTLWLSGVESNDFKKRRHAARLVLSLESMEATGCFNPTLQPEQQELVTSVARSMDVNVMPELQSFV